MTPYSPGHFDPRPLRGIAAGVAMMLLWGSRLTHGRLRFSPEGEEFPIKPMFAWSRAIGLPAYVLFYAYTMYVYDHGIPRWYGGLLVIAVGLGFAPMPGTIILTRTAIVQRFWMRPAKWIEYGSVRSIDVTRHGRKVRIVGKNGVPITFTLNHCAAGEYLRQVEERTGRQAGLVRAEERR